MSKYDQAISRMDPILLGQWETEQLQLKSMLIESDCISLDSLSLIGGMDISADKRNPDQAIASLVIMDFSDFHIVYENSIHVTLDCPYVPGFLAFREVPHLQTLLRSSPVRPDVVLVDGNGILHSRGFGLASHLGVIEDICTIGVGKTVFAVDGITVNKTKELAKGLSQGGEHVELVGNSGRVWGAALRSTDESTQPIIVSVGHKISLNTALEIVKASCEYRVPEPIRVADKLSRKLAKCLT